MPCGPPACAGQRGQVQPDRPALGPSGQLVHLGVGEPDTRRVQQRPGLLPVHRQLGDPDLHHLALSAQQRHRQGRGAPCASASWEPAGSRSGQLRNHVQTVLVFERLQVIKDQGNRLGHRRDHGQQPGHHSAQDRGAGRSEGLEQLRVDGLYLVQRGGDVGQEHHRVVVPLVD